MVEPLHETELRALHARRWHQMVEAKRSVLLGFSGMGGRAVAATAAGLLAVGHPQPQEQSRPTEGEHSVLVVDKPGEHAAWYDEFKHQGLAASVRVVTQQRVTAQPELLREATVVLPVGHVLTTTQTSAAWRAFAPVLRTHPNVVMYVNYGAFHRSLPVIELVARMDSCLLLHPRWGLAS